MKPVLLMLLTFFVMATPVLAEDKKTNPACGMQICLSTDNLKNGGLPCVMSIKEFKKIKKYRKHAGVKVLDIPGTLKRRTDKLNSCEGSRKSDTAQIMSQYGLLF